MIAAQLPERPDYQSWREVARPLLQREVAPERVAWSIGAARDLFGLEAPPQGPVSRTALAVPSAFAEQAERAALHRDPARFALLYRLAWRLQRASRLMEDAADPDVARLWALAKAVRRDAHKMHAFVRFKEIATPKGQRFVAWFEPEHHILRAEAAFFVRRFAGMAWSILTPDESAIWDGERLSFGPGGVRADAPAEDARDADWTTYYASMFNPARLKVSAMTKEMPKRYWRNLPEAAIISDLVRGAAQREEAMVSAEPTTPRKPAGKLARAIAPERVETLTADDRPEPSDWERIASGIQGCRACPLFANATQAVPGEGPRERPRLVLVGEQPGDQEDLSGRPFVGPAGRVLDQALHEAGIDRREIFVTNAVKHFKHEPRGKRRLHKRPDGPEIEACRWWLSGELALLRPGLVVALGVTALTSLTGKAGTLAAARGRTLATREGLPLRVTAHPSYLLRLPDPDLAERERRAFVDDLAEAWRSVA